jgi:uncharacterized membrane protein YfcA
LITTPELVKSILGGVAAGMASGFLGVSPGGFLVPVISLLLPLSQHVIQGISLVVQAPPTGLSGLAVYLNRGHRVASRPVLFISLGFVMGGPLGAVLAKMCSARELRWLFVGYLLLLAALAMLKQSKAGTSIVQNEGFPQGSFVALIAIGIIAGVSSGLLGIGGGLAITALAVVLLRVEQHQAQALGLAITTLPLTLPAAWVYVRQGWRLPWAVIAGLLAGLIAGTRIGALFANRLAERNLKIAFATLLIGLAIYMGATASR